jgi:hypothetical protein
MKNDTNETPTRKQEITAIELERRRIWAGPHLGNARAVDGSVSGKVSEQREPNKESESTYASKLSDVRICARQASGVKTVRQREKRTNDPPTDTNPKRARTQNSSGAGAHLAVGGGCDGSASMARE